MQEDLTNKLIYQSKTDVFSHELCDKIRSKFFLHEKELPDKVIKKTIKLSNSKIKDWILDNQDGFRLKRNGILVVSKFLPKAFKITDLDETIEAIMANPKRPQYVKDLFSARMKKAVKLRKAFRRDGVGYYTNTHSLFYIYKVMWFNKNNCSFDKAYCYEFDADSSFKSSLNTNIVKGKEYFEWNFHNFYKDRIKK